MASRGQLGKSFHLDTTSCKYPGCTRARYCEPYGFVHEFCGKTHATAYSRLKSSGYQSSSYSDFKPKKSSQDTKHPQGRRTPVVADHSYIPKSSTSMFSSPTSSWYNSDIKFYHSHEPYYCFTNFSHYPIQLDGKLWPTTEHYFQAQKFIGTPYEEAIRRQSNARGAFDMSRNPSVSYWKRGDWEQVKDDIMLKCLRAKFTQHKDLKKQLLDTGGRKLIEHTSNDSYWGDGGDGSGQNKLGKLLMQVREEISKQVQNHQHHDKISSQFSTEYGSLGKKKHEKKHRRSNSISGTVPTVPTSSSITDSQLGLTSSKQKFRSTESLYHSLYPPKKDTPSLPHTSGRTHHQYNGLISSDKHTQYKPTIRKSNSYSDLSQLSHSKHTSMMYPSNHHRYSASTTMTGRHVSRTNESSVPYNIITHT